MQVISMSILRGQMGKYNNNNNRKRAGSQDRIIS